MQECLFCRIVQKKLPAQEVYRQGNVVGFKDIYPQAKEHYLFIHVDHTKDLVEMLQSSPGQALEMMKAIGDFAQASGLAERGFRLVTNNGRSAGQSVFHTHFHVISDLSLGPFGSSLK